MKKCIYRDHARALGLARYSTGVSCLRGHPSERFTIDGDCTGCRPERGKARRAEQRAKRGSASADPARAVYPLSACKICKGPLPKGKSAYCSSECSYESLKLKERQKRRRQRCDPLYLEREKAKDRERSRRRRLLENIGRQLLREGGLKL